MSKKNLIIAVCVIAVVCVGGFFIFNGKDNSTSNRGGQNGLDNNYDSGYSEDNVFEDGEIPKVEITFGDEGKSFIAEMENNETAIELVRNITSSGRRLPIYNFDNFEGYEYYQYYDIPTSYKIPSNPTKVTSEKAGEIYYSSPNRVMVFYQDANIEGNFTKIGEIKNTSGLRKAVEENPVLEGWGNKIVVVEYEK